MACPVLLSPMCKLTETVGEATGGAAARGAAHSGLEAVAEAISKAIAGLVRTMMTWWIGVPSVDVSKQPVIGHLRDWFLPIAVAVTIAGLIAAGARMAATRKANPLIDVTGGLLVIAITAAIGVLVPNLLLKAGDTWAAWVLDQSVGENFGRLMAGLLSLDGAAPGFVVIVGVVVLILSALQALLMLLRETAIVILIGVLPLAAAGAMAPGMRGWIKKVVAWLLALIFYKPAAAAVYATAFTLIGDDHSGIRARLMGVCALILSLVALPVLIKFFTFATGTAGQYSGGGILGAATGAMVAMGSLRSGGGGGGSAVSQAQYTSSHMPPPSSSGNGGSGGTPSGAPAPGGDAPQPGSGSGDGRHRRGPGAPGPTTEMATAASAKPGRAAPGSSTASGTSAASTGAGGAASGTTGGAAGGTAGATAAGAAGGPAGAAAAAGVVGGQKAADGARNAAGSAMTPDGSDSQ